MRRRHKETLSFVSVSQKSKQVNTLARKAWKDIENQGEESKGFKKP